VVNYRCPIEIGQVWINPGDLIFGDLDGVLMIPAAVYEQVIQKALEKADENWFEKPLKME
jgi:regulator of RNase E activity RraA